jgi:hypothetical protein
LTAGSNLDLIEAEISHTKKTCSGSALILKIRAKLQANKINDEGYD